MGATSSYRDGFRMSHRDSGWRCLVAHYEGGWENPRILPPCVKCADCAQFIRPEKMDEECPMVGAAQVETANDVMRRIGRASA